VENKSEIAIKRTNPLGRGRPRSRPITDFGRWLETDAVDLPVLAQRLGVSLSQVLGLRRGHRIPSLESAARIIQICGDIYDKPLTIFDFLESEE